MKKSYFLLIIVIIIILTALVLRLIGPEDTWICRNGEWIKHGEPRDPQPTTGCLVNKTQNQNSASSTDSNRDEHGCLITDDYVWCAAQERCLKPLEEACEPIEVNPVINSEIIISEPQAGDLVVSPLIVKGQARGSWFFEASLPVKLVGANNQVIVAHYGTAESDWMTTEFVPFTAILEFNTTATSGLLIVSKDNPSGLSENDNSFQIPVNFK